MFFKTLYLAEDSVDNHLSLKLIKELDNGLQIIQTVVTALPFDQDYFIKSNINLASNEIFKLQQMEKDMLLRIVLDIGHIFNIPFDNKTHYLVLENNVKQNNLVIQNNIQDVDIKELVKKERLDFLSSPYHYPDNIKSNLLRKVIGNEDFINLEWALLKSHKLSGDPVVDNKRPKMLTQLNTKDYPEQLFWYNKNPNTNDLYNLMIKEQNNIEKMDRSVLNQQKDVQVNLLKQFIFTDFKGCLSSCYIGEVEKQNNHQNDLFNTVNDINKSYVPIVIKNPNAPIKWDIGETKNITINNVDSDGFILTTNHKIMDIEKQKNQRKRKSIN